MRLALEWFGDLRNPQPQERSKWLEDWVFPGDDGPPTFRTPDWGSCTGSRTTAGSSAILERPAGDQTFGRAPAFHEPDLIGTALSALPSGVAKASADSGVHNKDVLRAEKLRDWKLLRWDGTTLWADPERVWQRDGRVALRVLSTDGSEWLDPLPLRARP